MNKKQRAFVDNLTTFDLLVLIQNIYYHYLNLPLDAGHMIIFRKAEKLNLTRDHGVMLAEELLERCRNLQD